MGIWDQDIFDLKRRKHANGHWGNHDNNKGILGYAIVIGIFIVAFVFLILFKMGIN